MNRSCKNTIVVHTLHTVIRMPISIGLLLYKSLACRDVGPQHGKGVFASMSSICRLIVREHSLLPIITKTFAFYRRKSQVCLFADRNARFGPVPTEIVQPEFTSFMTLFFLLCNVQAYKLSFQGIVNKHLMQIELQTICL